MKQQVRELLVTAKVAQNWGEGHFDQRVDEVEILHLLQIDEILHPL